MGSGRDRGLAATQELRTWLRLSVTQLPAPKYFISASQKQSFLFPPLFKPKASVCDAVLISHTKDTNK